MASRRPSLPLWVALSVPLFLTLGVGSLVTSILSVHSGLRNAETVIEQLSIEVAHQVNKGLESLMSQPLVLNQVNHNALESGVLSMADPGPRDRFFAGQMAAYPEVSYSYFGRVDGSFYGARRNEVNAIEVIHNDRSTGGASEYYSIDDRGNPTNRATVIPNFDCRTRPWYKAGVAAAGPVFSDIYRHFVYHDLAITAASAVYDPSGVLQGVLGVDFRLDRINGSLAALCPVPGGTITIVERQTGLLVGNSMGLANHTGEGGAFTRVSIGQLDHPFLPEIFIQLTSQQPLSSLVSGNRRISTSAGLMYTEVFEFRRTNLDWVVLLTLPQAAFTKELDEQVRNTTLASVLTVLVSLLLGALVLGRALRSLHALGRVADRIAGGDWSTEPPPMGYRELDRLSQSFGSMAAQIKASIDGLESTVEDRTRELAAMNSELAEANQTKDKFLAILAHDLLGPVDAIAQLLESIAEDQGYVDAEEIRFLHRGLATSSRQVYHLLDNLLQWAQSQRGEIAYHPQAWNLDDLIADAAGVLVPKASSKDLRLVTPPSRVVVWCDADMVRTLVRNLVSNAIKFSHPGSEVRVIVEPADDRIVLSVQDQGVGIPADKLADLFDLAKHTKGIGTQGERGTGLGLILCQEFASRHQTTLTVQSVVGQGSRFSFSLPLAKAPV